MKTPRIQLRCASLGLCSTLAGFLFFPTAASAQNLLSNPGFEEGTSQPTGWKKPEGLSAWVSAAHSGKQAISVTGNGKNSHMWRTELLALEAGKLYRLKFWGRRDANTTGGCVVTGTGRVNRDCHFSEQWQPYSFVFAVPHNATNDFVKLGQWEINGTVYFDDVELVPVEAVFSQVNKNLSLGDGERIEHNVYHFNGQFGGQAINYHRPLLDNRSGFNSDRWTISKGSEVTYAHIVPGTGFKNAKVRLNVNYYVNGTLKVEARRAHEAWQTIGALDGQKRSGTLEIPPGLLPATALSIRLSGEGASCNLQCNNYDFEAELTNPLPDAEGQTHFVEVRQVSPGVGVRVQALRPATEANGYVCEISTQNLLAQPTTLQVSLAVNGKVVSSVKKLSLAAKETKNIQLRASFDNIGSQDIELNVFDTKNKLLYSAQTTLQIGHLQDPRPGYWLADDKGFTAWWCESGWKIGRERNAPAKSGKPVPISLSAAQGEYEAVQVVLTPRTDGEIRTATARWQDTKRRSTGITVTVHEVAYVKVTHVTDSTCERGWHPDPLPLLQCPLKFQRGQNQPLWLTFQVPRETFPGTHEGELELQTSEGTLRLPFRLEVYGFALPRETHLQSGFGLSSSRLNQYYHLGKDAQKQREVYEMFLKNFAEHRISPYSFFDYDRINVKFPGTGAAKHAEVDFTQFDRVGTKWLDKYGFTAFRLPLQGMGGGTFHSRHLGKLEGFEEGTPEHARLFKDYLGQVERHLKERGWLDKAYTYWFDEPDRKDYGFVVAGNQRIKAAAPGLQRMLTEQPEPELLEHVDIWCGLTPEWSREKVAARRAAGQKVWWYICCAPKAPYVTEFIDHPGTELRLWPWQSWQYGVQGILVWETVYWTSPAAFPSPKLQDPWSDPMSYVAGYGEAPGTIGYWGNGDGRFLYPPRNAMTSNQPCLEPPVTSIRWENLRDGMEDYEYLWLLQEAISEASKRRISPAKIHNARQLLEIPESISQDLTHFTTDPRTILKHRDKIARTIELLAR